MNFILLKKHKRINDIDQKYKKINIFKNQKYKKIKIFKNGKNTRHFKVQGL